MSRTVLAVLLGTFLAFVAATVWVPARLDRRVMTTYRQGRLVTEHRTAPEMWGWVAAWDGRLRPRVFTGGARIDLPAMFAVHWPVLIAEQALILVLGGSLLTWALRRDRRRRAEASA